MATIEKKGNGYRITVSLGYDMDGKQRRKRMMWTPDPKMTPKQAAKELNRQATLFEEECLSKEVYGGSVKLSDFAERWFADYADMELKPTTVQNYRTLLPRINQALGSISLDKLQPRHIIAFYKNLNEAGIRLDTKYRSASDFKELLAKHNYTQVSFCREFAIGHGIVEALCAGKNISKASAEKVSDALALPISDFLIPVDNGTLSGKTRLHYHRFLAAMLETAVQWQLIKDNPCRRVKAPRSDTKEASYLDEEQARALVAALDQEPINYRTMIFMILNIGLRRGELLGLSWSDVNLKSAVLTVRNNAVYLSGKGVVIDTPKTESSCRSIKMPASVIPMLKQYKAWQSEQRLQLGDVWKDNDLIFTSWDGSPMRPDTLTNWFAGFIRRHDLPHVTIHGLRHTNASLLIAAGTNLRTVSGRLGHSQASTTANIYAHAIQSADAAAADIIGDILSPRQKKAK